MAESSIVAVLAVNTIPATATIPAGMASLRPGRRRLAATTGPPDPRQNDRFKLQSGIYRDSEYKKSDANYFLAELKLHEGDCQLIEVVDDRAPLSAITEVSEMAINAGFKDIRPFIYWHKTGRMAQVQFGPPIKFTMNANKLEQRVKKEK